MENISINPISGSNTILPAQQPVSANRAENDHLKKVVDDNNDRVSEKMDTSNISEVVSKVKEFVNTFTTKLTFDVDPVTNDSVIYVRDNETGKVIRQIPPEEMNKLITSMEEITGILFNRRV